MRLKNIALVSLLVVAVAVVTSIAWASHTKRVVTSLTLISIKSEIYSDLNVLKKIKTKDIATLTDDIEQELASSTINLMAILTAAGPNESREYQKTVSAVKRYTFEKTNELTRTAIDYLEGRTVQTSQ